MANDVLLYRYNARIIYSDENGTENIDSTYIRYFIIENLFRIILFQQKANLESKNQMFLYHIFLEF